MMTLFRAFLLSLILLPGAAFAQEVAFSGLKQDTTLPVEVAADALRVDQADGSATFTGNVTVGQGTLRLAAAEIRVEYGTDGKSIARLHATGGVTFANGSETAEATEAVYTIAAGTVEMAGNVLLSQGGSAMSGQRLTIDLTAGTGTMEGRVTTVFQPGKKAP